MWFCVYELVNPLEQDAPFYIGKGLAHRRPKEHMTEFRRWDAEGRPSHAVKDRNLHKLRTIAKIVGEDGRCS